MPDRRPKGCQQFEAIRPCLTITATTATVESAGGHMRSSFFAVSRVARPSSEGAVGSYGGSCGRAAALAMRRALLFGLADLRFSTPRRRISSYGYEDNAS